MPTYEYACRECGEHLEVHQTFDDAALSECPACHGPLRKVFGSIAIAFKGSGFYKTDSRSSAANGKPKKDGDRASSSSSQDSSSSSGSSSSSESSSGSSSSSESSSGSSSSSESSSGSSSSSSSSSADGSSSTSSPRKSATPAPAAASSR